MTAFLILMLSIGWFLFGALVFAVVLWWLPEDEPGDFEIREEERSLQRMTHAAMVQMLAEARAASGGVGRQP